jgi:hypothetical protein
MRTRRGVLAAAAAMTVLLGATALIAVSGPSDVLRVVNPSGPRTLKTGTVITCAEDADTQLRCDRIANLTPRNNARCIQIWGGPERALIDTTTGTRFFVSRANSCEMYRWDELQRLTK